MNENEDELTRSLALIVRSYRTYSMVWEATSNRAYQDIDETLHFSDIVISEVVPKEWFENPAICPEPFFYDMGRSLAIIEENYLLKKVKENARGPTTEISQTRRIDLVNTVEDFLQMSNRSPILLIPAELSAPLYAEPEGIEFTANRQFLRIGPNVRAQLFVTSKYADLKDLLLMDRTFGTWIYRLGNRDSLTVEVEDVENANLRITSKIRVSYRIDRPVAAHIIRITDRER